MYQALNAAQAIFFFNGAPPTEFYSLSLHDALPISCTRFCWCSPAFLEWWRSCPFPDGARLPGIDRKSTRLNSSHVSISYAVFCLKKKKQSGSTGNVALVGT